MKKVKIWQIGYISKNDWLRRNDARLVMVYRGYADVEDNTNRIEDEVFRLCNWVYESGPKPENLHADMYNGASSDIILNVDGENTYYVADPIGWTTFRDLNDAFEYMRNRDLGMFNVI